MPNAQYFDFAQYKCPMPNTSTSLSTSAQCPMPHAQCPMLNPQCPNP
ncbi:hypothetical protein [Nostoc sp. CHAB 5715]|nr:hypothetical protein [Nostoc sp. CHAB 5715]MCC5625491.1 hypothetical protein [Nostoc sp. CHAB 5715]